MGHLSLRRRPTPLSVVGMAVVAAAATLALLFGHAATSQVYAATILASDGVYPASGSGYDVSWPQCSSVGTLPGLNASTGFGIVGATNGRAYTTNPCLASEASWASASSAVPATFYMNLNAPVGSTASNGNSGPAGTCKKSNTNCVAYNYGYNAATYAFAALPSGVSSAMWWLDIETGNSWSKNKTANDYTIEGAVDYIQAHGAQAGIYSTAAMWSTLAGTFQPGTLAVPGGAQVGIPVTATWLAGATSGCGGAVLYSGGVEWLAQVATSPIDQDVVCF